MAFEVGRTYRTRGGGTATITRINAIGEFSADHGDADGGTWWHLEDGRYDGQHRARDLLPTPIDAPTDGEAAKPVIDQDWKDDARAALAALITGRNWGHINGEDATIQAWANGAALVADALAAIRAERGRVG